MHGRKIQLPGPRLHNCEAEMDDTTSANASGPGRTILHEQDQVAVGVVVRHGLLHSSVNVPAGNIGPSLQVSKLRERQIDLHILVQYNVDRSSACACCNLEHRSSYFSEDCLLDESQFMEARIIAILNAGTYWPAHFLSCRSAAACRTWGRNSRSA